MYEVPQLLIFSTAVRDERGLAVFWRDWGRREERRTVRSAYCNNLCARCDTSLDTTWTVFDDEAVLGVVAQLLSSEDEGCQAHWSISEVDYGKQGRLTIGERLSSLETRIICRDGDFRRGDADS